MRYHKTLIKKGFLLPSCTSYKKETVYNTLLHEYNHFLL
jgi:hypothetical protein